jgi:hypothetical protein
MRYNGTAWQAVSGMLVGAEVACTSPQLITIGWARIDMVSLVKSDNITVDLANDRFTIIHPGWYTFGHFGWFEPDAGGTYRAQEIRLNGAAIAQDNHKMGWTGAGTNQWTNTINRTAYLSAGQYIDFWEYEDARTMYYYGQRSYIAMHRGDFV